MGSVVLVPEVWDVFLIKSAVPSEAVEATSAAVLAAPHLSDISSRGLLVRTGRGGERGWGRKAAMELGNWGRARGGSLKVKQN